jgi:hypothetical protein
MGVALEALRLKEEFVLYATHKVAHGYRRMQTGSDERSKEARSGDTMGSLPSVRRAAFYFPNARPWPLRAERSKQREALEARASWPSSTRRHGSGFFAMFGS